VPRSYLTVSKGEGKIIEGVGIRRKWREMGDGEAIASNYEPQCEPKCDVEWCPLERALGVSVRGHAAPPTGLGAGTNIEGHSFLFFLIHQCIKPGLDASDRLFGWTGPDST
jgi:hypothetical protein